MVCVRHAQPPDVRLFHPAQRFSHGDRDYLRNRLKRCQQKRAGTISIRSTAIFCCGCFTKVSANAEGTRRGPGKTDRPHPVSQRRHVRAARIEKRYGDNIQIPDKAFERIFDYFDQYQWHLDERPLRADNEINPDVLGYIFEKYINQKQMGAYYTKEDITEYISKNTVLPFLFDAARPKCKIAFENPDGPTIWDLLRGNPDRYIYDAVKKGVGNSAAKRNPCRDQRRVQARRLE